jgi:hypothetical protein
MKKEKIINFKQFKEVLLNTSYGYEFEDVHSEGVSDTITKITDVILTKDSELEISYTKIVTFKDGEKRHYISGMIIPRNAVLEILANYDISVMLS